MKTRPAGNGTLVLMGSGELTATMVEVHKALLARLGRDPLAVFVDTPAGFQLNVDSLCQKAADFFARHVGRPLVRARLTGRPGEELEAGRAMDLLQRADYILVGPGSPTYALRHWRRWTMGKIFHAHLAKGGVLVAASAAALTLGRFTLPVYEIYKAGADLHWEDGLDVLQAAGLQAAVIPHWNNAEGATHDTRFCYMGAERITTLEKMLPPSTALLGIDEHTACIIDLARHTVGVRGLGSVTWQERTGRTVLNTGRTMELARWRAGAPKGRQQAATRPCTTGSRRRPAAETLESRAGRLEAAFAASLAQPDWLGCAKALLELDAALWQALADGAGEEELSQARETMRELIARLAAARAEDTQRLCRHDRLIEAVVALRQRLRRQGNYETADALRDLLQAAGVTVQDGPDASRWYPSSQRST